MTSIITKGSVAAVVVETTEGTLAAPASGDYLALQSGFDMESNFDSLENEEIRASLAPGQKVLGAENPACTFPHYFRNSGVEGQEPNYGGKFLRSIFGASATGATEYDTGNGSSTSALVLGGSESQYFRKGDCVLIKDGVNGYKIRPIHAASGATALELGFNIDAAPSSGVNLGKATTYYPANSGHQSLSVWHYYGNGGVIQASAGNKVTGGNITFEAGQMINAEFSLEGTEYFVNPFIISDSNKYLDFNQGASELSATLTTGSYKDPHDLASALTTAMNAVGTGITVTYSDSTGKFTIVKASGTLTLLWKTGTHGSDNTDTHVGTLLGFSDAADDSGVLTYTGDTAIDIDAPHTPSYDDAAPLVAKDNLLFIGDADDNSCFAADSVEINIGTPISKKKSICSESGNAGSVVTERTCEINVTADLDQYDVSKFARFRQGTETRFFYVAGTKSGGNWVAGYNVGVYAPHCSITAFKIVDNDGRARLEMTLETFAPDDGTSELAISFV